MRNRETLVYAVTAYGREAQMIKAVEEPYRRRKVARLRERLGL